MKMKRERTMTFEWPKWRIRSNDYGFQVERRLNLKRWKAEWYHPTLAAAVQDLLEYRIRTETSDCIIRATDEASARASTTKLVKKIDSIAGEIMEGIRHAD